VHAVKERRTPELTDALVKARFDCADVLDYRVKVRQALEAAAVRASEDDLKDQLLRQLSAGTEFPVPPALIERRVASMVEDYVTSARRAGLTVALDETTIEKLRGQFEPLAREQIKAYLVVDAIARKEGIEADDNDVATGIERIAASAGTPVERVRAVLKAGGKLESLHAQLRDDKTIAHLLAQSKITDA